MISLLSLLTEATLDLDVDVDYVYKKGGFEKFLKELNAGKRPLYNKFDQYGVFTNADIKVIKSGELKSAAAILAHEKIPINIYCGFTNDRSGNHYDTERRHIRLTLTKAAVEYLYFPFRYNLSNYQEKLIKSELTEERIKASIYHELSHWVRDALGSGFLSKLMGKASESNSIDIRNLHNPDVNMTTYEIDAVIHGIKQVRNKSPHKYDNEMLLSDLFYAYPPLLSIYKNLRLREDGSHKVWLNRLLKRMSRENLIGKNMNVANSIANIHRDINDES